MLADAKPATFRLRTREFGLWTKPCTTRSTPSFGAKPTMFCATLKWRGNHQILPYAAIGCWELAVERPLRPRSWLALKAIEALCFASGYEPIRHPGHREKGRRPAR